MWFHTRQIELWLAATIALLAAIAFGVVVLHTERGGNRFGVFGDLAVDVAATPSTMKKLTGTIRDPLANLVAKEQRFDGQSGFDFAYPPGSRPEAPYVLVNRYDGDLQLSVSELVDLNSQETLHRWVYEVDALWAESGFESEIVDLVADRHTGRFRGHGNVAPDGSIVLHGGDTPLLKYDLCGTLQWQQADDFYHHSVERDADGNYWSPITFEPRTVRIGPNEGFRDDGLAQVSPDGEILFRKSVIEIFDENGLGHLIRGTGAVPRDPIHLNDIEPISEDGVLWRRGDVLLSARHLSIVLLYRPETNEVLWWRMGPWMHQHDAYAVDDRHFTIFDNMAHVVLGQENAEVDGTNLLRIVDVTKPHDDPGAVGLVNAEGFEALDIRTITQGRGRPIGDGHVFVEETNYGRLVAFDAAGAPLWSYVNRAEGDGRIYTLNWSRMVDRETGDAVRAKLSEGECND